MNIAQLMKQANQMQKKLNKIQKEFNEKTFEFSSKDTMIQGQMKGNMEIIELHIDASLLNDKESLEASLIETLNQKRNEIAELKEKEIESIAGNVTMPNLF